MSMSHDAKKAIVSGEAVLAGFGLAVVPTWSRTLNWILEWETAEVVLA